MKIVLFLLLAGLLELVNSEPLTAAENEHRLRTCGEPPYYRKKMMGGKLWPPKHSPWVVGISWTNGSLSKEFCSGTVISSRHVITAASCIIFNTAKFDQKTTVFNKNTIRLQEHELKNFVLMFHATSGTLASATKNDPIDTIGVKRVFIPRQYRNQLLSDIAVIELQRDIADLLPGRTDNQIMAACLYDRPIGRDSYELHGFGASAESIDQVGLLQQIITFVVPCENEDIDLRYRRVDRKDEYCTKSPDNRHPCIYGDDGAGSIEFAGTDPNNPSVMTSKYYVVGVASEGDSCHNFLANPNLKDYNTAIQPHERWICRKTGICPPGSTAHPNHHSDDEVEVIETGGKKIYIDCDDWSRWSLGGRGIGALCFSFIEYPRGSFNYGSAKQKCAEIGGVMAPIRNEWDRQFIAEIASKVLELDERTIFVGGELDIAINRLRWTYDNSLVSLEPYLWLEGNPSGVYGKGQEYEMPETVLAATCNPKKQHAYDRDLRLDDVQREHYFDTSGVVCAKKPIIREQ